MASDIPSEQQAPQCDPLAERARILREALHHFFATHEIPPEPMDGLVRTVFLRILQPNHPDIIERFEFYAMSIARTVALEWLHAPANDESAQNQAAGSSLIGAGGRPPERLAPDRPICSVAASMLRLPERQRRVFVLRRLEGVSFAQIASRLGISESAAEKDLQLAMRAILTCDGAAE